MTIREHSALRTPQIYYGPYKDTKYYVAQYLVVPCIIVLIKINKAERYIHTVNKVTLVYAYTWEKVTIFQLHDCIFNHEWLSKLHFTATRLLLHAVQNCTRSQLLLCGFIVKVLDPYYEISSYPLWHQRRFSSLYFLLVLCWATIKYCTIL